MLNPSIMLMSMHIESKIAPRVADRSGYVPWNVGVLEGGIDLVKQWIGPAFNIALWIFLILRGIFILLKIIHWQAG